MPWGPIHSIGSILTNGLGGKHEQASDERLIWYNALAFLSRGNVQLSYALATMAKKAADADLARDASELASQLERAGADPRQSRLVNPWRSSVSAILVHILMAFALPGVVAAAIFLGAGASDTTSSYSDRLYSPPPSSSHYEPESQRRRRHPIFLLVEKFRTTGSFWAQASYRRRKAIRWRYATVRAVMRLSK